MRPQVVVSSSPTGADHTQPLTLLPSQMFSQVPGQMHQQPGMMGSSTLLPVTSSAKFSPQQYPMMQSMQHPQQFQGLMMQPGQYTTSGVMVNPLGQGPIHALPIAPGAKHAKTGSKALPDHGGYRYFPYYLLPAKHLYGDAVPSKKKAQVPKKSVLPRRGGQQQRNSRQQQQTKHSTKRVPRDASMSDYSTSDDDYSSSDTESSYEWSSDNDSSETASRRNRHQKDKKPHRKNYSRKQPAHQSGKRHHKQEPSRKKSKSSKNKKYVTARHADSVGSASTKSSEHMNSAKSENNEEDDVSLGGSASGMSKKLKASVPRRTPSQIFMEEEKMLSKPRRRGCCFGCNACFCGACDFPGGCCSCMNCRGCCDREFYPPTGFCARRMTFDAQDYRRALLRRRDKLCCTVE